MQLADPNSTLLWQMTAMTDPTDVRRQRTARADSVHTPLIHSTTFFVYRSRVHLPALLLSSVGAFCDRLDVSDLLYPALTFSQNHSITVDI